MPFDGSISSFLEYLKSPSLPSSHTAGRFKAVVYSVDYTSKEIKGRILGLFNGQPLADLPTFYPFSNIINIVPSIGSWVWVFYDTSISFSDKKWFWESIAPDPPLEKEDLEKIELIFGKVDSDKARKVPQSVNPSDFLDEMSQKNKRGSDVKRVYGMPVKDEARIRTYPGDVLSTGPAKSGILHTYGDINNSILYIYSSVNGERPGLNDNVIILCDSINIGEKVKDVLPASSKNKIENIFTNGKIDHAIVIKSPQEIMILSDNKTTQYSNQIIVAANENLLLRSLGNTKVISDKNISLSSEEEIKINVGGNEIVLNKDEVIIKAKSISLKADKVNIESGNANISARQSVTVKATNINLGNIIRIANGAVDLGQKVFGLIKDTFLQIFNAHFHISGAPGTPTTPPTVPATPVVSTTQLKTSL